MYDCARVFLGRMEFTRKELKEALREVLMEFFAEWVLPANENDFLNVTQAARLLNLAEATVYEKTSLKKIRHYKKGKRILFKRSDLIEWMETGTIDAVDERQQAVKYLQSQLYRNNKSVNSR
jgi:excisionase family DNA binding protein